MATPNADRLHGIEEWRTSSIEHALDLFSSVTEELAEVADINREVSSDLGLEGGTADAACRILRTIAADMDENADSLTQIVNVSRDALQAGIQAKYESQAIQADLAKINNTLLNKFDNGTSAQSTPELAAYYKAQLDAAHAKIEKRATKTLTTLDGRALTAIGGLPFQDQIRAMLGRDNPGLAQRLRQHMEFGRTAPADNGRPPAPPARSATDWRVSPDRSLGSPGSHTGHTPDTGGGGSVGGGVSLQGAHYSPGRSAVVVPGSPTPHAAPIGGAGHDPLLGLGLGGGAALGAGVAGFRAYQAARAARAAEAPASRAGSLRSGAAIRSTPPASGSVLRGTNTARTPASPTASTASRGGAARGGATGAARPVSSSSSSSGSGKLLRGATTAQRAAAPKTPSRGSGMLKGAVTAPRKPTGSTEPVGKPGRAQTETAPSRTTGTNSRGASSTRGSGTGSKTANASRGAASTATTGNTRGTGSNAKTAARGAASTATTGNTRGTGSKTASARTAARGTTGSAGRTGAARAGAGRSGASSLAVRPQTGKVSQQVRDGSTSQALHSLGRRTRDADRKKRDQAGGTDVTAYETDNTVTFLEAGPRTTNDDEDTAR